SLWPCLSARRSGFRHGGRAHFRSNGRRATARRALQQMVPAPAAHRRDAEPADEPAIGRDFPYAGPTGIDNRAGNLPLLARAIPYSVHPRESGDPGPRTALGPRLRGGERRDWREGRASLERLPGYGGGRATTPQRMGLRDSSLSSNRNQPLRRQLLRARRHRWLHDVFDSVFTDLEPHLRPDPGREAVMEAGPDARICNLLGERRQVGPTVGNAWCGRARRRDLRNVLAPERRLDNACDAAAQDAMRARVFRVHRRVGNRPPSCLAIRGRVVIDIGIANCRHWPPEIVVVLG